MAKYGFNVTIGADTRPFATALRSLNAPILDAQKSLTRLTQGLKLNPMNTALLSAKMEQLGWTIQQTKDKLAGLKAARENLIRSANGKFTEEQYQTLTKLNIEIATTEEELKKLQKEYKNFGSISAQQLIVAGKNVQDFGKKVTDVGNKLRWLSLAAAGLLGGIVKTAADFEDAWVGVTKTVDGADNTLRQSLIDMAKMTGVSKNEIAGVAQAAGQLGIGKDSIADFTKVMVNLGIATDMTAEDAAMNLARLANITQMSKEDYGKLGATITHLGNNYAVTESEIVNMATRLASTGDLVGLNQAQIMALATAMGSLGAEAEAGGTAMSKMFRKMKLSIETGDKNLEKFAKVSGMSVKEFKESFEKDALGTLNAFTKGLAKIEADGGSAIATLDDMKLSEVRLSDALLKLVGGEDLLSQAINDANTAWNEGTALEKEAQKRYEEFYYKLGQVRETLGEIAVKIGDTLLPIISDILVKVQQWVDKFTNMDEGTKKVIVVVLLLVAALSPLLVIIGNLIVVIGGIMVVLGALGVSFAALSAPVLAVVAVIGVLIGIFIKLWNTNEDFRTNVMNIWNTLSNFFTGQILPRFSGFLSSWVGFFRSAFTLAITIIKGLLTNATIIVNGVIGVFSGILTYLQGVFTGNWRQAWEGIKNIFSSIIESIKGLFSGAIDWMSSKISGLVNTIASIPDKIQGIKNSIGNIRVKVPGFASGGIVTSPTLAMIGEGSSAEAVVPLDKLPKIMAEAMKGIGVGGANITIYTQELDSQKLEQIVSYVDRRFGASY